jgi:antitoxin (DNA-binding transcriptional repressor) of toxin-antitoxin stability system
MVRYLSVDDAAMKFAELVKSLAPGDEIAVTDGTRLVARIHPVSESLTPRQPGLCKGMIEIIDDSDDVILEHFKDYIS